MPENAILLESGGRNSWDSLPAAARLLDAAGPDRVLLVSDPSHALRIRHIAAELGLNAFSSPTDRIAPGRMAKEAAGVALARIIGWARRALIG